MDLQTNNVWTRLQNNGIVHGTMPDDTRSDSPWYVKVLLAFCGWLAAIFILGFIGAAFVFVFKSPGTAGIIGGVMIAAAFSLLRISANEFIEHLGMAISLAGQVLIAYALFESSPPDDVTAWLLLALLQTILAVLMPNFVHRVFSTLVGSIALTISLKEITVPDVVGGVLLLGASVCWLNEFNYPAQIKKVQALGYGLVLALMTLKGTALFGYHALGGWFVKHHGLWARHWLGEVIAGAVTVYVVWRVLQRYRQPMTSRLSIIVLLATVLVCAVSIKVQGITLGMVIICFGFLGSNRVLLGLGIVSLLFYISTYYYLLDTTLLNKSISLALAGLGLLVVRWLLQHIIPAQKET